MALIHTLLGELDDSLLDRLDGELENDNERTTWVEYRLKGQPESEPIHRSVHVTLKQMPAMASEVESF